MMRSVFLLSTALFWTAVFVVWSGPPWRSEEIGGAEAVATDKAVTMTELARHAKPSDCWMAIDNVVYDFTAYLPRHPADPDPMAAWCGKEATEAYRTKTQGRPHSPRADQLLPSYRIGRLAATR
jgi:cytochrome b involved in lipid metabolism